MMRLVRPSFEIMEIMGGDFTRFEPNQLIEKAGRTCYKSEDRITGESANIFVRSILERGHESVIEHSAMTVKFIIDRGVSHELVRHRLCAFSQESTRYCNYKGGVTFVIPPWLDLEENKYYYPDEHALGFETAAWIQIMQVAENTYINFLERGWSPQQARSVLPNSLKTEIVVTTNFREWRHIFKLRTAKSAHPQMREIMVPLLVKCKALIPVIFDDINGGNL